MADTPDATGRGCLTGPLETVAEASARYVIRGTVNQGGYGLIRVAFDTVLQEVVALKTVHRHYSFGNSNLTKEAQIGRQVKSHFVVRIYDLVVINGELCLVMEYINGKTLLQLYKNARPAPDEFKRIVFQLTSGLADMHSAHYSHGDLKPDNILVEIGGRIVIVDLNLAMPSKESANVLRHPFRAPELLNDPDLTRSDIFALGGVFQFLRQGLPGDGSEATMDSAWIAPIVTKCMRDVPGDRFSHAGEVLAAIGEAKDTDDRTAQRIKSRPWQTILSKRSLVLLLWTFTLMLGSVSIRTGPQQVRMLVAPLRDNDPIDMLTADAVAVYLETAGQPTGRVNSWSNTLVTPRQPPAEDPVRLGVTLRFNGDLGRAAVRIRLRGPGPERSEDMPPSSHPISDLVRYLSNTFRLVNTSDRYDVAGCGSSCFSRLATAWRGSADTAGDLVLANELSGNKSTGIPALLAEASIAARLYSATGQEQFRDSASRALDQLTESGVNASELILLRSSLASNDDGRDDRVVLLKQGTHSVASAAPLLSHLAALALRVGFTDESLVSAQRAVQLDPWCIDCYSVLAKSQAALWQNGAAVASLEDAARLDPGNAAIHSQLGTVYIKSGRYELARRELERSIAIRPTPESEVYLGLVTLLCGDKTQALLLLRGAVATHPTMYSLVTLGAALRWLNNPIEGQKYLSEAIKLGNPKLTDGIELGRLALAFAQLGRIEEADNTFRRALTHRPPGDTEMLYDSLVIDAFAGRREACKRKYKTLQQHHFPLVFIAMDPQVSRMVRE